VQAVSVHEWKKRVHRNLSEKARVRR